MTDQVVEPAVPNAGGAQQAPEGAGTGGAAPAGVQPSPDKAEGTQPAEGEGSKGAEVVNYEFTAPEGIELDKALTAEFVDIAKELKLPQADAQKIMGLAVKLKQAEIETHRTAVNGWAEQVKADKELGGDKLTETLATAKKAIDLGPPELKDLLNSTGMGNHPAVVRWAYTVGKALSEDRFVKGTPGETPQTVAKRLFPDMNP